ncbi:MAG: S8 family serine peptidase [Acidimicrobiia bacterium]
MVPGVFSVDVAAGRVAEVTRLLEARPEVERVEPDRPVQAFTTPNDPCVTLCPFPRPSQWALGKIGAFGAWDVTKGSPDVLVAVVDSGVTTTNPDLGGKVVVGPGFAPAANTTRCAGVFPEDHGTNVAGIVAAATDNAVGIAGLGWNTRVLSIKVLDNYGCGDEESVAKGIVYAADQPNVRVINLSLGVRCDGTRPGTCPSATLGTAVRYAQDHGKLVVAAAGNGDGQHGLSTPVYPAAYPNVLAVAATDRDDALWAKSNYGPWVDLAAPGVEITSTYQDFYGTFDGTSEAAPFVSATAALVVAAHPELDANEVAARILAHTDWIPGTGTALAHGRLDTGGAVRNPPRGYWLAGLDGGVYTFGTAGFHGSAGGTRLAQPVIGIAATPSGNGYWLVATDGGIFAFGDARFVGSTGAMRLNQPIVGMAATPSGNGYWLVARDGGIFAFGDAVFLGSTGAIHLARPIVGMASTSSGGGYWLVASDGGMFAFGDAAFLGSTGGQPGLPIVTGMATTGTGQGYWLLRIDGTVAAFGDAPDLGRPPAPAGFVIGIAARH